MHPAPPVQAEDARRTLERTEHDRHPAVLAEVSDGLDTAAGEVEVGHRPVVEDSQGVMPLRREVHVATLRRGGGHEEHVLLTDPRDQLLVEGLAHVSHGWSLPAVLRDLLLGFQVLLEPREGAGPRVGGGLGVVARPLVAVEPVLGTGVAHDLGGDVGTVELGAEALDVLDRDGAVLVTEEAEPRGLEARRRDRSAAGTGGTGR